MDDARSASASGRGPPGSNMTHTEDRAREALEAQGFKAPGPEPIQLLTDAIATAEAGLPAGGRVRFDYVEVLVDTPELIDRTDGPLTDPGSEISHAVEDVLTDALNYVLDDEYVVEDPNS